MSKQQMGEDKAKSIVVQMVVAIAIREHPDWSMYPEIGEHDWEEITRRAEAVMKPPPAEKFAEAYAVLETRAGVKS